MKYCIEYNTECSKKLINSVEELIIRYNKKDFLKLIEYAKSNTNQRIIFSIDDIDECLKDKVLEKFITIKKENPDFNFSIRLAKYNKEIKEILKEANFKFFFNIYVNDWDTFIGLSNLNVSDIYITENLGFEIDKVAAIAHKKNIQIRVFPNVCQSSWLETDTLKTFFIRPEDIDEYESYVDVIQFFDDGKKLDVLYDIYHNDKKWFGKLNEIIIGLDSDIDSRYIIPRFAQKRIKCGKECFKNGRCKMCERVNDLSKTLQKAKLLVKLDKKKEESEEKANG